MASRQSMQLFRALRTSQSTIRQPVNRISVCRFYSTSTEDAPAPLLSKLKADLKTAMRAKDTPHINPIKTDVQLVALIRKIQKGAQDAAAEAKAANRDDLVQKEEDQIKVLNEYITNSGVESLTKAQLKAMVQDAVEASKAAGVQAKSIMGDVMKRLSGALEGKDVDKKELSKMVKELTALSTPSFHPHNSQNRIYFTMASRQNISSGSAFEEQIGYSRAVVTGDWVFVSGTTGYDYATGKISADVTEQADQTMINIATALESASASVSDVVRVKYILPDRDDFPKTWPVLKKWFGEVRPAATMVQSALMKDEMKIEIEVTARIGCGKQDK
ncbi:hypothetical protein FCULG_00001645 [Fusarium culmorum]|uniref:Altered inheritance of mitochondria protein 41 n=2 Tax=Fusarium culmorum TaxID=5516 RepID=A0A2T4GQJ4_FUSCU|nr:hypothetical protein FCULG_00001645 [Fusarium culmorum]